MISKQSLLKQSRLPSHLVLPLNQQAGAANKPLVSIGEYVLKGQKIADTKSFIGAPIHAPSSGTITQIEIMPIPHASGLSDLCIEIKTDGKEQWIERNTSAQNFSTSDPGKLRAMIREGGIVGLGGAAFPSAVKLDPGHHSIDTLIINAVECEPYITCDDVLMQNFAAEIIDGIDILLHVLQSPRCLIGIEENKPEAITALQQALEAKSDSRIKIVTVPTRYPSGSEKQLIKLLTGREVPSGGLPSQVGIICQNVGTVRAIKRVIIDGEPLISRIVTITGEGVNNPANLETLIGTPIAELIEQCAGYSNDVGKLIMGGPMMGFTLKSDDLPIQKASNCILVMGKAAGQSTEMSCIRCGACADVCPAQLLPQQMLWHCKSAEVDKAKNFKLFDCIECGCCDYVCPSEIPLVQYFRHAKSTLKIQAEEKAAAEVAKQRFEFKQKREEKLEKEKEQRLIKKRELLNRQAQNKDATGDAKSDAIQAALARVKKKKIKRADESIESSSGAEQMPIDASQVPTKIADAVPAKQLSPSERAAAAAKRRAEKKAAQADSAPVVESESKPASPAERAAAAAKRRAEKKAAQADSAPVAESESKPASPAERAAAAAKRRAEKKAAQADSAPVAESESKPASPAERAAAAAKRRAEKKAAQADLAAANYDKNQSPDHSNPPENR